MSLLNLCSVRAFFTFFFHMCSFLIGISSSVTTTSKRFEKLIDRHFTCEIPLQSLAVRPETVLFCASACHELDDCTTFDFIRGDQDSCVYCLSQNITALNFVSAGSQTETWVSRQHRYIDPRKKTLLPAPGDAASGNLIVFKGKASIPLPEDFYIDLWDKERVDRILRIVRFKDPQPNFIRLNSKVHTINICQSGNCIMDAASEFNPYAEGEDYEVDVLTTRHGFVIYVNGQYVLTYNLTICLAGDVAAIRFKEEPEIYDISF